MVRSRGGLFNRQEARRDRQHLDTRSRGTTCRTGHNLTNKEVSRSQTPSVSCRRNGAAVGWNAVRYLLYTPSGGGRWPNETSAGMAIPIFGTECPDRCPP